MSHGFVLVEKMSKITVRINGNSMWPLFRDGDVIECEKYVDQKIMIGDLVVFHHPYQSDNILIKRVIRINEENVIVQGDNPDPTASTDSHNFGSISTSSIIAIRHTDNPV